VERTRYGNEEGESGGEIHFLATLGRMEVGVYNSERAQTIL
jgi:hypothetical protein